MIALAWETRARRRGESEGRQPFRSFERPPRTHGLFVWWLFIHKRMLTFTRLWPFKPALSISDVDLLSRGNGPE